MEGRRGLSPVCWVLRKLHVLEDTVVGSEGHHCGTLCFMLVLGSGHELQLPSVFQDVFPRKGVRLLPASVGELGLEEVVATASVFYLTRRTFKLYQDSLV